MRIEDEDDLFVNANDCHRSWWQWKTKDETPVEACRYYSVPPPRAPLGVLHSHCLHCRLRLLKLCLLMLLSMRLLGLLLLLRRRKEASSHEHAAAEPRQHPQFLATQYQPGQARSPHRFGGKYDLRLGGGHMLLPLQGKGSGQQGDGQSETHSTPSTAQHSVSTALGTQQRLQAHT
jgi:hypothetical protein